MKVLTKFFSPIKIILACSTLFALSGCAQTVQWKEDVQFLDGRVVTILQKKWCRGGDYTAKTGATCLAYDALITMKMPEFFDGDIIWHEALNPMVINVYAGKLYIVGVAPTNVEFRKYGAVNPPYYAYMWDKNSWVRLSFDAIPVAIYDTNMLIESIPKTRTGHVTLLQKREEVMSGNYTAPYKRIDPNFKRTPH